MTSSALAPHAALAAALVAALGLAGCSSSSSLGHAARLEPPPAARLEPVRRVKSGDSTLTFFAACEPRSAGPCGLAVVKE